MAKQIEKEKKIESKIEKPSADAMKKAQKVVDEDVKVLIEKKKALSDEIQGAIEEKKAVALQVNNKIEEKTVISDEIQQHIEELKKFNQEKRQVYDEQKQFNKLGEAIRGQSEETVVREIKLLEYKLVTSSPTLNEEKKIMLKIKQLRASIPGVKAKAKEYETKLAANEAKKNSDLNPVERGEEVKKMLEEKKGLRDAMKAEVDVLKAERTEKAAVISKLQEEKKGIQEEIVALNAKKDEIFQSYQEGNLKFKEQADKEKKSREDKWARERAAIHAAEAAEHAQWELEQPYPELDTIFKLEQCLIFVEEMSEKKEEEIVVEEKPVALFEGAQVLVKKQDRTAANAFFKGSKKSMLKKQKVKKVEKINHTLETLESFMNLNVPAPLCLSDLPDCKTKLEEILVEARGKQKVWQEERKKKVEEAEKIVGA